VFGWDFWHNNNNTFPETSGELYPWHDTVVAGIMAANGSGGVSGVCPNAFVYVMKKDLDDDFYSSPAVVNQVITGLNYAINLKSELQTFSGKTVHMVINNSYAIMHSLADWNSVPQLKTAIDAAAAADIGMFFAATNAAQSNDNPATAAYPASYASPNIVSVGAVDASDHISSVSNFGNAVHIAAPGVGINMVLDTGQIGVDLEGTQGFTSFATPHVTAAAAMYWSQHPNASFAQVKAALLNTADHIPGLPVLNGNRLNLGRLIAGTSISPDGMIISGGTGSLITSAGTWTFGGSVASGEWSILLNGSSAGGGIGSKMEVSNGGKLYALGTDGNWYLWTGSTWTPGSPQGTTASPDGTIISGGTGSGRSTFAWNRGKRSVFRLRIWLTGGKAAALTELEFVLRTAKALVTTFPDKATNFATNALALTVDPRLRNLVQPALAALGRNDTIAARKWLDRACEYERARHEKIKRQTWSANTGNLG
jgi:hypothetical protein